MLNKTTTHNSARNSSSKTGTRRQNQKKHDFKGLSGRLFIGNHKRQKGEHSLTSHNRDLQGTLLQPLQCDLQPRVASPHLSARMAAQHGNSDAAIPVCDLQPKIPNHPIIPRKHTHTHKRSLSRLKPQFHCGKKNVKTIVPATAAHTRHLSSPTEATLPEKPQGFVSRLSPKAKPIQHPCSHYNAFCNLTLQTRISPRTQRHNMATQHGNIDAAFPLRSAAQDFTSE